MTSTFDHHCKLRPWLSLHDFFQFRLNIQRKFILIFTKSNSSYKHCNKSEKTIFKVLYNFQRQKSVLQSFCKTKQSYVKKSCAPPQFILEKCRHLLAFSFYVYSENVQLFYFYDMSFFIYLSYLCNIALPRSDQSVFKH